jgi:hypothetical protein
MDSILKDSIAKFLHDNYEECRYHTISLYSFTSQGFTEEEVTKTLRRLVALGLITDLNIRPQSYGMVITPALEEFIESGGYTAQQKILELQKAKLETSLQYLYLQIKECEKTNATLFNNLTTGFNNVVNLLGLAVKTFC